MTPGEPVEVFKNMSVLLEKQIVNPHQARPLALPALPCRGRGQALKLPRVDLSQAGGALAGEQGGGLTWTGADLGTLKDQMMGCNVVRLAIWSS